jgi:hypothetical protein
MKTLKEQLEAVKENGWSIEYIKNPHEDVKVLYKLMKI